MVMKELKVLELKKENTTPKYFKIDAILHRKSELFGFKYQK